MLIKDAFIWTKYSKNRVKYYYNVKKLSFILFFKM